jgi:hypothetical protein
MPAGRPPAWTPPVGTYAAIGGHSARRLCLAEVAAADMQRRSRAHERKPIAALAPWQRSLGDTIALAVLRVVPMASLIWAVLTAAAMFDSVIVAVIVVATASLPIMVMLWRLSQPAHRIRRARVS